MPFKALANFTDLSYYGSIVGPWDRNSDIRLKELYQYTSANACRLLTMTGMKMCNRQAEFFMESLWQNQNSNCWWKNYATSLSWSRICFQCNWSFNTPMLKFPFCLKMNWLSIDRRVESTKPILQSCIVNLLQRTNNGILFSSES